ncbi:MAG TPA: hypothetical protein DD636_05970 [Anaerolineaceae bacterium]|jgi:predicted outer membrane repeat protein|nr:hypothetical protein [Anaerolineaceae bacterium]
MKRNVLLSILTAIVFLSLLLVTREASGIPDSYPIPESILHVKSGASGNCYTWEFACDLQTALTNSVSGDQIWVASGTYLPTSDTNRSATFQLKSGVAIYGGFPADGGEWEDRDWKLNITTLSGNINIPEETYDNSFHVVTGSGVTSDAILDGFTITEGFATQISGYDAFGGGMNNISGNPTLANLIFVGNRGQSGGGGMYNSDSHPSLTNVIFSNNATNGNGGGMFNENYSQPTLTDVIFSNNTANHGGGMSNYYSDPTLTRVTFNNNSVTSNGGGIEIFLSSPSLTNVTFTGNFAAKYGGGINAYYFCPNMVNVTISNNTAGINGGGIYNEGMSCFSLINSILWGNTPNQIAGPIAVTITYSTIQGGYTGEGNSENDPLLGPLADNGGVSQTHALLHGSPAIDTGSPTVCPTTDQRGFGRPTDGDGDGITRCDMGAFEFYPTLYLPLIMKN